MLTPELMSQNWDILMSRIDVYIEEPRRSQLKEFYEKFSERIIMMPASYKKEYHNAFPGGYVDHVIRVIDSSLKLNSAWVEMGVDDSTYTIEELVFAALNHDLGKIGDENHESYISQTDQWRREKLGEDYMFNDSLAFASVPDRSLFLLQSYGIKYSFNEMIAIQTHDGLYDEGNKKYLMTFNPGQKPRTSLPFILHQADLMASRIEFEREWLHKFKEDKKSGPIKKESSTLGNKPNMSKKISTKEKALGSFKSEGLKNIFDNL
jgi:hypothetical protein